MNPSGKLHALLSTARVANIPSVVSNVWLGVALGTIYNHAGGNDPPTIAWSSALSLAGAGVSLYIGGNFLNDWADQAWDAKHRPERALPRGLFPAKLYGWLAVLLAIAGVALTIVVSMGSAIAAAAIVACICIYTYWHKRSPWAVIPMGLCRALLPVMGVLGISTVILTREIPLVTLAACVAGGLLCYIMGLSLSARYESMAKPPVGAVLMARTLLVLAALVMSDPFHWISEPAMVWGRFLPYGIWLVFALTIRRKPVPAHVSCLLAGIPLLDWIMMMPVISAMTPLEDGWTPAAISCFAIPPLAFISALLLQRLAPAT